MGKEVSFLSSVMAVRMQEICDELGMLNCFLIVKGVF